MLKKMILSMMFVAVPLSSFARDLTVYKGSIKFYNNEKSFGFLFHNGTKEEIPFFTKGWHSQELRAKLTQGTCVTYTLLQDNKGRLYTNDVDLCEKEVKSAMNTQFSCYDLKSANDVYIELIDIEKGIAIVKGEDFSTEHKMRPGSGESFDPLYIFEVGAGCRLEFKMNKDSSGGKAKYKGTPNCAKWSFDCYAI